jgi:hypothetical protein
MTVTDSGVQDTPGFAAVPNWMIRDTTISTYAIAVYAALASHSGRGGIHPSHVTLASEARCSERTVRSALDELRALGVVESRRRTARAGRASNSYTLHPNGREVPAPRAATSVEVPAPDDRGSGTTRRQVPAPRAGEEEPLEEEPPKKTPLPPAGVSRDVVQAIDVEPLFFQEFYAVYPRHVAKQAAEKAFRKAIAQKGVTAGDVIEGARRFAADPNLPEAQYVPHPASWLNAGRWDDDPLPPRTGGRAQEKQRAAVALVRGYQEREEQEHEEVGVGSRPRLGLVR